MLFFGKKNKKKVEAEGYETDESAKDKSKVLNFLWLNLDLPAPPDPEDGSIRQPLPEEYIGNVRAAGKAHPAAEIDLWVDSKRLTERQMVYLKYAVENGMENVHLKDLRTIPEYSNEELYDRPETNPNWRSGYSGVIWLQVDSAKILISLQGKFDQHFFADMDHYHLDIESKRVQKMIGQHGLMIGSSDATYVSIENQLWGFNETRRKFFEEYYATALENAYNGWNGFGPLCDKVYGELTGGKGGIRLKDICLRIGSKGMAHAVQPGHEWSGRGGLWGGKKKKEKSPAVVSADKVAEAFNAVAANDDGGKADALPAATAYQQNFAKWKQSQPQLMKGR